MTTGLSVAAAAKARSTERRGLILAFAVFGSFWGAWAAVLPEVRSEAQISDGQLGLALAAVALAAVPIAPFAGRLADRLGAGRTLPACLAAFACVLWLPSLARSLPMLALSLAVLGVTTGALDVLANTAAASWERIERDHLMSLVHGAFSVGVLVGSASAGLARQFGAGSTAILAVVAVATLAAAALQPPYRFVTGAGGPAPASRLSTILIGIGILTACAFLAEDAIQSWSALHLERGLDASPAVSGLGPALFAGSMAVGRLSGGALVRRVREDVLVGVAGTVLTVGVLLVATAPSIRVALVGLVVAGSGASILAPVLFSAVGRRAAPGRQGAELAKVTALGYVGFVAGPPLVGVISAATSLPFALGSLSFVAVALAVGGPLLLRPKANHRAGEAPASSGLGD